MIAWVFELAHCFFGDFRHPITPTVAKLLKSLDLKTSARNGISGTDPQECLADDVFGAKAQEDVVRKLLREADKQKRTLMTLAMVNLAFGVFGRGIEIRQIDLAHLGFTLKAGHRSATSLKCYTDMMVLTFVQDTSKDNKKGEKYLKGIARHKLVEHCAWLAVALWLFDRYVFSKVLVLFHIHAQSVGPLGFIFEKSPRRISVSRGIPSSCSQQLGANPPHRSLLPLIYDTLPPS